MIFDETRNKPYNLDKYKVCAISKENKLYIIYMRRARASFINDAL